MCCYVNVNVKKWIINIVWIGQWRFPTASGTQAFKINPIHLLCARDTSPITKTTREIATRKWFSMAKYLGASR